MTVPCFCKESMTVAAAVVLTAAVTFAVMVVMVAADIGVKTQGTCQKICNRSVSVTAATAVQGDTCLRQCHLGAAADTTADQHICVQLGQYTCQRAVATAVGIHDFRRNDR